MAKQGRMLFWAALGFIALALGSPKYKTTMHEEGAQGHKLALPREGIALYFLLDQSGSMTETVETQNKAIPKMDLAKEAITQFIEGDAPLNLPGRKNDLVGLMAFARVARLICPLTLNRSELLQSLSDVQPLTKDSQNGTAIGYAIFKAINIIVSTKYFAERQKAQRKPAYVIQNQAIILVTDGLQSPNPDDRDNPFRFLPVEEAIRYAVENGVRVYYVGVDPVLKSAEFKDEVEKLQALVKQSGGEFYIATYGFPVQQILAEIDTLEKSSLTPKSALETNPAATYMSLIPFCILAALICIACAIVGETIVAKTIP